MTSIPAVFLFFMSLLRKNMSFYDFSMICHRNNNNLSSTRGTTYKTSILDPIKFWWVAEMPEMVVPKSSHDRSCSKKSSPKPRSTITISESANWGRGAAALCPKTPLPGPQTPGGGMNIKLLVVRLTPIWNCRLRNREKFVWLTGG